MVQWLRRRFVTGFVVTVPLVISVVSARLGVPRGGRLGRAGLPPLDPVAIPGLGMVTTAALSWLVGAVATNVIGKRLLQRAEGYLMMVPVFRTVYSPVKQLVAAFSPDNESGFKKVALVEDPRRGQLLGFLTKEFIVDRGSGPEPLVAVYVPTNHLYLGDVVIVPSGAVFYPDLSVEDGVRIFLTGGMALPLSLRAGAAPSAGRAGCRRDHDVMGGEAAMGVNRKRNPRRLIGLGGLVLVAAMLAGGAATSWRRGIQPGPAAEAQAQVPVHHGGEASLVLPDLSQARFLGIDRPHAADVRPARRGAAACFFGLCIYHQV